MSRMDVRSESLDDPGRDLETCPKSDDLGDESIDPLTDG